MTSELATQRSTLPLARDPWRSHHATAVASPPRASQRPRIPLIVATAMLRRVRGQVCYGIERSARKDGVVCSDRVVWKTRDRNGRRQRASDHHGGRRRCLRRTRTGHRLILLPRNEYQLPFFARCAARRSTSPLKVGEEVEVIGMAPWRIANTICSSRWTGTRKKWRFLSQLEVISADDETREAVEDWLYWSKKGYQF